MLAEHARVSTEAISALERGRRKTPQRETLELLLHALQPNEGLRAQLTAAAARPSGAPRRVPVERSDDDPNDRSGGVRRGSLPRPLTTFFGREPELRTLRFILSKHRLVTLTGGGGVGKTRTAIELAARAADDFTSGAWFVELGPLRDEALVPKTVAAALAIAERTDAPLLDVIVAALRDRHLLLVLDNCEHVIDAAASTVYAILSRCPSVTIVAASREPLRVDGEAVYRLTALEVPRDDPDITPNAALTYSAVALFVERSSARDAAFVLTGQNAHFAAEICRRLDGNPLALELAAAKTNVLSLAQIAARLNERFSLLTGGARTALPRHQTLRALVEWSFDLLGAEEQELFLRLAVFSGSWNLAAAEAVAAGGAIAPADVMALVSSLVDKSLVIVDPASPDSVRFRLLETTREYAAEQLRETGKLADVMRLQTAYVLTFARHARELLKDLPDTAWLDMVESELENVRTALEWSLRDANDVSAGAEIAAMFGFYWDSRSWDEGTRWLLAARRAIEHLDARLAALVLQELVRTQPTNDETFELAKQSLQAYRDIGDDAGVASALEYLGQTLINLGRYPEAIAILQEGIVVAQRAADAVTTLRAVTLLAVAHLYGGDMQSADVRLIEARALFAAHTRVRDQTLVLRVDAEVALAKGDGERALDVAARTLDLAERAGDLRGIGIAHYVLAHALAVFGRAREAQSHAVRSVQILAEAQIPFALAEAYLTSAAVLERLPDDERAARLMGFARRRAAELSFKSAFVIKRFVENSATALIARLGNDRFDRLSSEGAAFDEARARAELNGG